VLASFVRNPFAAENRRRRGTNMKQTKLSVVKLTPPKVEDPDKLGNRNLNKLNRTEMSLKEKLRLSRKERYSFQEYMIGAVSNYVSKSDWDSCVNDAVILIMEGRGIRKLDKWDDE